MAISYDENMEYSSSFRDKIEAVLKRQRRKIMVPIEESKNEIRCRVTKIMLEMGMPAHLRGYHYLREAICLSVENMELVGSVTKLLYPEIAKMYESTNEKVERAIRSVIEVGWQRGNQELFEEIFGYSRVHGKVRPTNSEFILGVADKIQICYTIH